MLTPDFRIVAVSDAYLRATMTRREEILGQWLFDVFPNNPDDDTATGVNNLRGSLTRVLQNKAPDTMAVQKYDIRRPESEGGGFEQRFWSPINTPVVGPDGEVTYIIHRVEDVTGFVRLREEEAERSKLTEELRTHAVRMESEVYLRAQEVQESNRKLEDANAELARLYEKTRELDRLKTTFFSTVSHELRTPLTLILGPVEKMLGSAKLEPAQRKDLTVVSRNAHMLLHHVNDLLDVAKLEAGKMDVHYSRGDLAQLLRVIASNFDSLAKERGIDLSVRVPSTTPIAMDVEKVERVLLNLLSNAFKFTPNGGRIRCELHADESFARLGISDSGPGVPVELRQVVFEPFRQGDDGSRRRHTGTGLGLAIVKEFLDLQGGTVSVTDATEGGALFEVALPLEPPPGVRIEDRSGSAVGLEWSLRNTLAEHHPVTDSDDRAMDSDRPLVLVIEDNPEMNRFIADTLSESYRVSCAHNGSQGLEKALELLPDLIVSDIMMPEMSGDMLVHEIRSRSSLDDVPIILLTARADEETRVRLLSEGAQDYLTKPFQTGELMARVGNMISVKRAREVLRKSERVSQEKYQLLMEFANDGLFILNSEGVILEANRAAERLLARPRTEISGQRISSFLVEENLPDVPSKIPELLSGSASVLEGIRLQAGDGKHIYADVSSSRVTIDGIEYLLFIAHDVSSRVVLEQSLRQMQKMEAVGQLTAGIAHDFNNLLSIVIGDLELLAERVGMDEKSAALMRDAMAGAERGAQLTQRLLGFARRQSLQPRPIDLNEVVERMSIMLRRTLPEDIAVKTSPAEGLWQALADPSQVEDAILNLAVNARDAMPNGGQVVIETANTRLDEHYAAQNPEVTPGDYAALIVSDSGGGMPPHIVERAFDPFFTTKAPGHGTGLGLSMIYGFVKQSRGHIKIYSEPGHGTSVKLYLPRSVSATAIAQDASEGSMTEHVGKETILLVEDDPSVREIATMMLESLGYCVHTAESGPTALQILQETGKIDLLFTDLVMPNGMSGYDLVVRAREIRPGLKVLFTSGYSEQFVRERDGAAQNIPILGKPYRKQKLAEKVRGILDGQ